MIMLLALSWMVGRELYLEKDEREKRWRWR